ncbi:putative F-box/FBD/LRR-repeat protein At4g03220 [Rutidosis leptorrhynchoides]|uniref:putative F-box/FBD/LRR-repeat protein At4g03220 n=1 Tax=Rutidosis leptorrhynchoides TaxID=125765 RepID=UPI003A99D55B
MDFDHNNVRAAMDKHRLSSLPDELIHQILSHFDTKFVVQTCLLLSPRWKLIWRSMPCLKFSSGDFKALPTFVEFVKHVLSHRDHKVDFTGATVQELTVDSSPEAHHEIPPCLFNSQTLEHLTFRTSFMPCLTPKTPWDFPALTTLYLDNISLCDDERESIDLFSKCVNLQNLTLERITVKAKVFDIITPRLSDLRLRLINDVDSNAIKVIAPQLQNLTIIDCSIKDLNIPSGFSSFYYKGYDPPQWFKVCFHSVNKVTVSLSIYCPNQPYLQEDARGIVNMFQELRSAKFLTLNLDIVECISSFPDLLSGQPSPFSNLICLKVDCGTKDTCKVILSSEARKFFLENSPTATFIVKEQPTEAMKEKEVKEQIKADIEDLMKGLQASLEQDNLITEKKVVIENLLNDIQIWTMEKKTQIESSERSQIEEIVSRLSDIMDMLMQLANDLKSLVPKAKQIRCLLCSMPIRHGGQMVAHYSSLLDQVLAQTNALCARQASFKEFVNKIVDAFHNYEVLTSEVVSSTKNLLTSQASSSSTIVSTPSTSSINPVP